MLIDNHANFLARARLIQVRYAPYEGSDPFPILL